MHHMLRLPFYSDDGISCASHQPTRIKSHSQAKQKKKIFSKHFLREIFIVLCCFSLFSSSPFCLNHVVEQQIVNPRKKAAFIIRIVIAKKSVHINK